MVDEPIDDTEKQKLEDELDKLMDEVADFIASEATNNIQRPMFWEESDRPPTIIWDTGELAQKINVRRTKLDKTVEFKARHTTDVEFGTPPGTMVDIDVLIDWFRRKVGLTEVEARNRAHATQIKIFEDGIPAHPFIRPAVEAAKAKFNITGDLDIVLR